MKWIESSEAVAVSVMNDRLGKQDFNTANSVKFRRKSVPLK